MKNIFCRVGSKNNIKEHIIKLFPDHITYVEPFIGSGAIYFHKKPSEKEVINDKDQKLMKGYRSIKHASSNPEDFKEFDTMQQMREFYNKTPQTAEDILTHEILRTCNTFGSKGKGRIYNNSNPYSKTKNIKEYKKRMNNTIILSQDYKTVIRKYDNKHTLFYIDPPYENSDKLYENGDMDYIELRNILSNMKGKFILSMNDSPNIRNIFNIFKMKQIKIKTHGNEGIGTNNRNELLIMNF